MTHLIELLIAVPLLIVTYRFVSHEMRERDKLSETEKAKLQDEEAW